MQLAIVACALGAATALRGPSRVVHRAQPRAAHAYDLTEVERSLNVERVPAPKAALPRALNTRTLPKGRKPRLRRGAAAAEATAGRRRLFGLVSARRCGPPSALAGRGDAAGGVT